MDGRFPNQRVPERERVRVPSNFAISFAALYPSDGAGAAGAIVVHG